MLFSPPSRFGKHAFYRLAALISSAHIGLMLILFVSDIFFNTTKIVISLPKNAARVRMASLPPKRQAFQKKVPQDKKNNSRPAPIGKVAKKNVPVKSAVQKKSTVPQKIPLKKTPPVKSVTKKLPAPKTPVKKVQPQKVVEKKQPPKKVEPIKDVVQKKSSVAQPRSLAVPRETIKKEIDSMSESGSDDIFTQELFKNLTIPPGFEYHEPITIACDVRKGKVVHIAPHSKGPLVLYAALKDALSKISLPSAFDKHVELTFK